MNTDSTILPLIDITPETTAHLEARATLIYQSFGSPNHSRAANLLRRGTEPDSRYSMVALNQQHELLGSVRFYPVLLPDHQCVLILGPLAINPALRGLGIGSSLVRRGLKLLQEDQWSGVLVIGDPGYFTPLGFHTRLCAKLDARGEIAPLVLMGLEWQSGFLSSQTGTISPLE